MLCRLPLLVRFYRTDCSLRISLFSQCSRGMGCQGGIGAVFFLTLACWLQCPDGTLLALFLQGWKRHFGHSYIQELRLGPARVRDQLSSLCIDGEDIDASWATKAEARLTRAYQAAGGLTLPGFANFIAKGRSSLRTRRSGGRFTAGFSSTHYLPLFSGPAAG